MIQKPIEVREILGELKWISQYAFRYKKEYWDTSCWELLALEPVWA